jgi:hypothetical protein
MTDINKKIGTVDGDEDYATVALFEAARPANAVTSAEKWIGSITGNLTFTSNVDFLGSTSNATYYTVLQPKAGTGFADDAGAATNALRYNSSNGIALTGSVVWDGLISTVDDYVEIRGLQLRNTASTGTCFMNLQGDNTLVQDCILDSEYHITEYTENGTAFVNCVTISHSGTSAVLMGGYGAAPKLINCTLVSPSDVSNGAAAIYKTGSVAVIAKGNVILGFGSAESGTLGTGSDYNVTTNSSVTGSNSITSVTYANQIENTSEATLDCRMKSGADGEAAGVQYTETNDLDIIGTARDTSTPCIGAWEIAGASVTYTQSDFRLYDDGTESGSTALEAQNVDATIAIETTFQVRLGVETTGDAPSQTYKIQWRKGVGSWSDV